LKIRWVTWHPAPYWNARFEDLASRGSIEFEALFLRGVSAYHSWGSTTPPAFPFRIVSNKADRGGYRSPSWRPRGVSAILRRGREIVVVMPYGDATCATAAIVARSLHIPYHLFIANHRFEERHHRPGIEVLKTRIIQGARGLLASGNLQAEYARRYARSGQPLAVIGNPADTATMRRFAARLVSTRPYLREKRGWTGNLIVAYVGRLSPEKGLQTLFRAVSEIRSRHEGVRIAIAGTGPEEMKLRRLSESLRVPVEFAGFLNAEDLVRFYAAIDVLVLPSFSEAWGLVLNEAMEFSVPIVVSERVGARELCSPGVNGFWFPPGRTRELSKALDRLCDPELRQRMGQASAEMIKEHTIENWSRAVVSALHEWDAK